MQFREVPYFEKTGRIGDIVRVRRQNEQDEQGLCFLHSRHEKIHERAGGQHDDISDVPQPQITVPLLYRREQQRIGADKHHDTGKPDTHPSFVFNVFPKRQQAKNHKGHEIKNRSDYHVYVIHVSNPPHPREHVVHVRLLDG